MTKVGQQSGELGPGRAQEVIHLVRGTSGYERPQRLGERCEGQPRFTEFDASADERNHAALPGSPDDLVDETGLADSGLPTDEEKT